MSEKPFGLTVRALVCDGEGRCLLLRRSPVCRSHPGRWELPGGKADPGEAFDAALVREVHEETGLAVALEHPVGVAEIELPNVRIVVLILEARLVGGALRLSEEHDEAAWVSAAELPAVDLIPCLKRFAKERAGGASAE